MKRNELKVIIAIILVMATLFALASLVSAGFVEEILGEMSEMMRSSSGEKTCKHTPVTLHCDTHGDYPSFICSENKCRPYGCTDCQNG